MLEYDAYVKIEANNSWSKTDPFKMDFKNKYMWPCSSLEVLLELH